MDVSFLRGKELIENAEEAITMRRFQFALLALAAIIIGFYPAIYFLIDPRFGLLQSKSAALLADGVWNAGFYTHITLGGLALLSGWSQFSSTLRARRLNLHRTLGKIYVAAVLISGTAGIYVGFFATGGWMASLGFICLGIVWVSSTLAAYSSIRRKDTHRHQRMMIYSYGACFAAVTLRIWLPLLTLAFGDFIPAYRLVAWLCWVPNLAVAHWIVLGLNKKSLSPAELV